MAANGCPRVDIALRITIGSRRGDVHGRNPRVLRRLGPSSSVSDARTALQFSIYSHVYHDDSTLLSRASQADGIVLRCSLRTTTARRASGQAFRMK